MAGSFLLSVIIPTRNRQFYARAAVEQILNGCTDQVQVVVQDNSDVDTLRDSLRELGRSERVVYSYTKQAVSFSENFHLAAKKAEGRYVCAIGDDDGILPGIEEVARSALRLEIPAVTPSLDAVFYWPQSLTGSRSSLNGCVVIDQWRDQAHLVNPRSGLKRLCRSGGQDYLTKPVVKVYHGLVSQDLLSEVERQTGKFFGGLSPDIYSSVALSAVAHACLLIGWPITLPGISKSSGSADSASGRHVGRLEDAPHFRGTEAYSWSDQVPSFYSPETIWAESAVTALEDMGETALLEQFDTELLQRILRSRYSLPVDPSALTARGRARFIAYSTARNTALARAKFRRMRHPAKSECGLDTISAAVQAVPDVPVGLAYAVSGRIARNSQE